MTEADEHVRYARFAAIVDGWERIELAVLDRLIAELVADPDPVMAQAPLVDILKNRSDVTTEIVDLIQARVPQDWSRVHVHAAERRLLLAVEARPGELEPLLSAIRSGSRRVQLALLERRDLPREAVEAIAAEGVTRKIREQAARLLPQ